MFVATESFTANTTRGDVHVEKDVTRVQASDELYVRYPDRFAKAAGERPAVEQATAGPGERRGDEREQARRDSTSALDRLEGGSGPVTATGGKPKHAQPLAKLLVEHATVEQATSAPGERRGDTHGK